MLEKISNLGGDSLPPSLPRPPPPFPLSNFTGFSNIVPNILSGCRYITRICDTEISVCERVGWESRLLFAITKQAIITCEMANALLFQELIISHGMLD